jgi:hypothetical protein
MNILVAVVAAGAACVAVMIAIGVILVGASSTTVFLGFVIGGVLAPFIGRIRPRRLVRP